MSQADRIIPIPTDRFTAADLTNMGYFEVIGEERTLDISPVARQQGCNRWPRTIFPAMLYHEKRRCLVMGYNATAIANFSRNQGSLFDYPGSVFPTLLNCEDTLDQLNPA